MIEPKVSFFYKDAGFKEPWKWNYQLDRYKLK